MHRLEPPYISEGEAALDDSVERLLTEREAKWAERVLATLEKPCRYSRYTRLDAWTLQQSACIISGIDPEDALGTLKIFLMGQYGGYKNHPAPQIVYRACALFAATFRPLIEEMRGSYYAGKLKILGPWVEDVSLVEPSVVVRWAASKGHAVPRELADLTASAPPSPLDREEAAPDREETPQEMVARMKRERRHTDEEIARALVTTFESLPDATIGALLPAKPGQTISYSGKQARGRRLLGKK